MEIASHLEHSCPIQQSKLHISVEAYDLHVLDLKKFTQTISNT